MRIRPTRSAEAPGSLLIPSVHPSRSLFWKSAGSWDEPAPLPVLSQNDPSDRDGPVAANCKHSAAFRRSGAPISESYQSSPGEAIYAAGAVSRPKTLSRQWTTRQSEWDINGPSSLIVEGSASLTLSKCNARFLCPRLQVVKRRRAYLSSPGQAI